ncbi:hypothetical protein [Flavobacterium selenitireducens]|uniref:hypothetical protein n=1 Tax=Flavobacterium selenitireducens TaxID=2722704 RepID=UPI00168B836F|nr:hypothetical protein [Flavobacterium selenitireducens]MBD3581698.1 hypothetical protein [Flavobacterium selenitireducens]
MKKIALLFALILAVSCSSDDDNSNSAANRFMMNGVARSIPKAYMIAPSDGFDPQIDPRRFYIVLTDGTVSYENGELILSDDIHQLVDFNLYTDAGHPGSVQQTTYTLWSQDPNFDYNSAYIGHASMNYDITFSGGVPTIGERISSNDMDHAQIALSRSGGSYLMNFMFSDETNSASGHYEGPVTILNP